MDSSSRPPDEAETPPAEPDASIAADQPATPADDESTVGTGSVVGIGCTIVVLLFICLAIAVYVVREVS